MTGIRWKRNGLLPAKAREHWIFRGQADERWTFRSTLERTIWSYSELRDNLPPIDEVGLVEYEKILSGRLEDALSKGLPRHFKPRQSEENISTAELEQGLIRRFQRHCHQYVQDTPRCNDIVEWLALMRHYGAPTRMLDWTWSFFVALFFALAHSEGTSAVWALNLDAIDKTIPPATQKLFDDDPQGVKSRYNQ